MLRKHGLVFSVCKLLTSGKRTEIANKQVLEVATLNAIKRDFGVDGRATYNNQRQILTVINRQIHDERSLRRTQNQSLKSNIEVKITTGQTQSILPTFGWCLNKFFSNFELNLFINLTLVWYDLALVWNVSFLLRKPKD